MSVGYRYVFSNSEIVVKGLLRDIGRSQYPTVLSSTSADCRASKFSDSDVCRHFRQFSLCPMSGQNLGGSAKKTHIARREFVYTIWPYITALFWGYRGGFTYVWKKLDRQPCKPGWSGWRWARKPRQQKISYSNNDIPKPLWQWIPCCKYNSDEGQIITQNYSPVK